MTGKTKSEKSNARRPGAKMQWKWLDNLKAAPGATDREEIPHSNGLYLLVETSGRKTWQVRWRFNGKACKSRLGLAIGSRSGPSPASLAWNSDDAFLIGEALAVATTCRDMALRGEDPAPLFKAVRMPDAPKTGTVGKAVGDYIKAKTMEKARGKWKERTASENSRFLNNVLADHWKGRTLRSITNVDVRKLMDHVTANSGPSAAIRALAVTKGFFTWLLEEENPDVAAPGPAHFVKAKTDPVARDVTLTDNGIVTLWQVAEKLAYPFGDIARLLLLTGQRLREVAEMEWCELDLDAGLWTIPAARAKNGRRSVVVLSAPALAILKGNEALKSVSGFVFTKTLKTPVSGFSGGKARIDAAMIKAVEGSAADSFAVSYETRLPSEWHLHDLRRTFRSGLSRLGIRKDVAEAIMNHASGKVEEIYDRDDMIDSKRLAFEAWAKFVLSLMPGSADANAPLSGEVLDLPDAA